jgi:hypothetical protein
MINAVTKKLFDDIRETLDFLEHGPQRLAVSVDMHATSSRLVEGRTFIIQINGGAHQIEIIDKRKGLGLIRG